MDCGKYQEALSGAALGAGSGAEVQAFSLHLEICEGCRRELARRREFLGVLDRHLKTQFEAGPSGDFNARLRRRIADEPRPLLRPSWQWLPALAGAAALAVVFVLFRHHHVSTPQPRNLNSVPYVSRSEPPALPVANSPAPPRESAPAALIASERPLLHAVAASRPSPRLEVRIDHHELYAVDRLSRSIADGRVNTAALLDSQRQPDEPVAAKPLDIPPLEVKPIEQPNTDDGSTER
jgi:hypothetical protein